MPGFLASIDAIKAKGVSNIVCVSVNDPFVMSAWGKSLDPGNKVSCNDGLNINWDFFFNLCILLLFII